MYLVLGERIGTPREFAGFAFLLGSERTSHVGASLPKGGVIFRSLS